MTAALKPLFVTLLAVAALLFVAFTSHRPSPGAGQTESDAPSHSQQQQQVPTDGQRPTVPVSPEINKEGTGEGTSEHEDEAGTNWWMVALTALLVIGTWRLVWVTNKSVNAAAEEAKQRLRAYVFIDGFPIRRTDPGESFPLKFKNFGQTPAYNVVTWEDICVLDFALTDPTRLPGKPSDKQPSKPPEKQPRLDLPPQGVITKPVTLSDAKYTEGSKEFNEQATIYVNGAITYKDAFGKDRFTNFRLRQKVGHSTGLMLCDQGNDSN